MLGLLGQEAIIQTRTGKTFQILAVGVGAEDHAFAVKPHAFAGIGENLRFEVGLAADEAERSAGVIADQRLAHAQHDFGENLALVARERIDGVEHEGVIGWHDLLNEHGHLQTVVRDTAARRDR